jgi:hypothetical protein
MTMDRGLPVGLDLTADLANDRALARANELAHNLAHASYCARDLANTSVSTFALAQAGASYSDRANNRARAVANYFDLDLDHALVSYRDRANELARDFASYRARASARALARALDRVLERDFQRYRALASHRDRDPAFDRDIFGHLEFARHLGDDLAHASHLARDIERDSGLIVDFNLNSHGHTPASDPDRHLELTAKASGKRRTGELARTPVRLAGVAARLLPAAARARYREEYQGELAELAVAGAGRRNQFGYALRLLTRAPLLRAELRSASRRRVVP